ncbi:tRNA threonylcarbamoyladenosine biosynthesis protein TsaE [Bdellovibrio bacteriovorus]|uniref:tRNA threonylcarbamoyladenosine biosynthesis protein TsaE n=1 Tax=Bdellovibrio bacteriovorus TaxID=959 RepID=A0A150WK53_BDEBC|nr:tRNA (adenosine(37)-N6)-threonylcarbamoyltransferase complex ATPase subunit type 1 TsaE [Bdellovibrio bacteriovorus]KYG64003.1 tRNA threonylcarbamoyladenosine biosynthesis protein TsaE [Bdellovibrio bacteriovorus]
MSDVLNSQREIRNLEELKSFWAEVLPHLSSRCILLMSGEVGAGKTTSVQMIASILGMRDVQSPSFAIHLRYENSEGKALDHLDLYRLKDDDDLESSGFWDLFAQHNSLMIIEWADRLNSEFLPMNWQKVKVTLQKKSEAVRLITTETLA